MTGDPLHSLHGTADLAEAVDRRRDVDRRPVLGAPVRRLRAARADRRRHPDRPVLRLALPPAPGAAAARRDRGDDRRLPRRPDLRPPADRPLRAHLVGPADALLRPRRRRLAPRQRPAQAPDLALGRHRHRRALDRVPPLARRDARRRRAPDRPRRRDVQRAARRPPRSPAVRHRDRALRRHGSAPPTTARSRTCATGSTPTRAASARSRTARARCATCCSSRATCR